MSRVFIERFEGAGGLRRLLRECLEWLDVGAVVRPESRVFIKPNLTWRQPTPGVTVPPAFLRAVVEALLPYSKHITVGESEGGQACFRAEDAFETHGLYGLAAEYGIEVVNLSLDRQERATATVEG